MTTWFTRLISSLAPQYKSRRARGRSHLMTERLEDRTLLTAYVVNTLSDSTAADGLLSLREAIEAASTNALVGDAPAGEVTQDVIQFEAGLTGTITLGGTQLSISGDLSIEGPGWEVLTVDANNLSRVFNISSGSNIIINGLTITGGNNSFGGGIENDGSTLLLNSSYVHGNTASNGGGGIDTFNGGTTTILNSTIANNTALFGAGINSENATTNVINSTVSGNSATGGGGGLHQTSFGSATITNSTITGNRANSDDSNGELGGGILSGDASAVTVRNSIIAGNFTGSGTTANDVSGTLNAASSFNVIGDAGTAGGLTDGGNSNIVGNGGTSTRTTSTIINTTLSNVRGAMVHDIVPGGVAHNNGSNALSVDQTSTRLQFDQRGGLFVRVMDDTVDIGAVEFLVLRVNTLLDETTDPDTLSLREALALANFIPGSDNISSLPSGTILLTQGQLEINDDLRISGPGADQLTIDAQGDSRIFYVNPGFDVEIIGLTLTGGNAGFDLGGAIQNTGNLTLRGLWITGNTAGDGGGLESGGGAFLTIYDSTISGNFAPGGTGGGIATVSTVLVVNSTISGNTASVGGGIGSFLSIVLVNSTLTDNHANDGGGLLNDNTATLFNTLVAGNTNTAGTAPNDVSGVLVAASSNNLIGDAASAGGLTDATNGNIVGVGGAGVRDINTILNTTLQNNGGPTPTHILVGGSAALNSGNNARATVDGQLGGTALTTDQRGFNRYLGVVDMGAVEGVGDDHGNDFTTATPIAVESNTAGDLEVIGDVDYFSFSAVAGQNYLITTELGTLSDSILELYDQDGTTVLAFNDDYFDLASRISWLATATGTFFIKVRAFGNNKVGTYGLNLEADDHGDTTATATFIPRGTHAGNIDTVNDIDAFVFDVQPGEEYVINLLPGTITGGTIVLIGPDGATVLDEQAETIRFTASGFGRYFVEVTGAGTGTYDVQLLSGFNDVILFDSGTGRWRIGHNDSTGMTWTNGPRFNPAGNWQTFTGDFNGDGLTDGLGVNSTNGVFWVRNNGDGTMTTISAGSFAPETLQYLMVGDFNGDGADDLIVNFATNNSTPGGLPGSWYTKSWNGTQFVNSFYGRWEASGWVGFTTGDVNFDGATDIIGIRDATGFDRLNITYGISNIIPNGSRRFAAQFAGALPGRDSSVGWHTLLAGDWDNDGRTDIAARRGDGRIFYATAYGDSTPNPSLGASRMIASQGPQFSNSAFAGQFFVGDFDGDGRDDIATRQTNNANNNLWVATTAPVFPINSTPQQWGNFPGVNVATQLIGDWNGDGLADFLSFEIGTAQTWVSASTGSAFSPAVSFGLVTGGESLIGPLHAGRGRLFV